MQNMAIFTRWTKGILEVSFSSFSTAAVKVSGLAPAMRDFSTFLYKKTNVGIPVTLYEDARSWYREVITRKGLNTNLRNTYILIFQTPELDRNLFYQTKHVD